MSTDTQTTAPLTDDDRAKLKRLQADELNRDELELIYEALDSHEYWQLSDENQRNDGASKIEDGENEEIDACRALAVKINAMRKDWDS